MQLKKIWIKDYKNLKDFSLDFEKCNGLSILIGNNGSGKSNVLEAISGIFAEAYSNVSDLLESDYILEYQIKEQNFKIEKINGRRKLFNNENPISVKTKESDYLPSNVIAIYSGEDLRLWEKFYWQRYYEYLTSVYRKGFAGNMGMYYVNKYLWNISLLTLVLFKNDFPDINTFLSSELGIDDDSDIDFIEIDYSNDNYDKNRNEILKAFVARINPEREDVCAYTLDELRNLLAIP